MAVHAHPDDECISTGGALARYAREGVRTVVVTCTGGEVGEISDPALATPENLGAVRQRELAAAAAVLDIGRSVLLGYRDSGMRNTPPNDHPESFNQAPFNEALERLVRVIREERPSVLVTYDENGIYGHPDHVRAHDITVAAFEAAGDPARFPEAGAPWTPAKLYYAIVTRGRAAALAKAMKAAGIDAPFSAPAGADAGSDAPPFGVDDGRLTTEIDVAEYVAIKRAALAAHRTQMGPDQFFMRMPEDVQRQMWGTETFQRIAGPTAAPAGELETDLFSGLP